MPLPCVSLFEGEEWKDRQIIYSTLESFFMMKMRWRSIKKMFLLLLDCNRRICKEAKKWWKKRNFDLQMVRIQLLPVRSDVYAVLMMIFFYLSVDRHLRDFKKWKLCVFTSSNNVRETRQFYACCRMQPDGLEIVDAVSFVTLTRWSSFTPLSCCSGIRSCHVDRDTFQSSNAVVIKILFIKH